MERGYVASLARPGGNITGLVFQQLELAQKQAELLTQAFPERKRVAMLFDGQSADQFGAAERAAKALGLQVQGVLLEKPPYDVDAAFRSAASGGGQMALVLSSPSFFPHRDRIVELAPGQCFVVPKGIMHRTRAPQRTVILMVENAGIIPTGD